MNHFLSSDWTFEKWNARAAQTAEINRPQIRSAKTQTCHPRANRALRCDEDFGRHSYFDIQNSLIVCSIFNLASDNGIPQNADAFNL